ncbi:MAG: 16S rRNA (guanine(527)-N(7))-methyltransferase RsmG [Pseudomonadales bacterium]
MSLRDELVRGLKALNARPELEAMDVLQFKEQFLLYLDLLKRWNKTFNLTAIRDDRSHVTRHILDSLVIAPFVKPYPFSDVGSGAGLPGIPLAICQPSRKGVLIDANGKKTRFLTQVKIELGLHEIEIVQGRIEDLADRKFKQIVCRAFKPLDALVPALRHALSADGVILAMIGKEPESNVLRAMEAEAKIALRPLSVPGLEAERYLAEIRLRSEIT